MNCLIDLIHYIRAFAICSSSLSIIILFIFVILSLLFKNLLKYLKRSIKLIIATGENKYELYKEMISYYEYEIKYVPPKTTVAMYISIMGDFTNEMNEKPFILNHANSESID